MIGLHRRVRRRLFLRPSHRPLVGLRVQLAPKGQHLSDSCTTTSGVIRTREHVGSSHPRPLTRRSVLTIMLGFTFSFFLSVVNQLVVWLSLPLLAAAVAYSMLWFPQIARSAMRGRTAALTTEYLIGTTICRLLFALCLYLGIIVLAWTDLNSFRLLGLQWEYPGDYSSPWVSFDCEVSCFVTDCFCAAAWIWTFAGWIAFQVFVILLQDLYGPAFFLPARASPLHISICIGGILTVDL